ncbi:uncharacterized protein VTP21DRAFT_5497 [Calcarisporiella thermophila]|uniref:uncharacterized protein n=1 Tax=Calcarisporiella thermophila TaxID=911321 RepID=UPI0037432CB4
MSTTEQELSQELHKHDPNGISDSLESQSHPNSSSDPRVTEPSDMTIPPPAIVEPDLASPPLPEEASNAAPASSAGPEENLGGDKRKSLSSGKEQIFKATYSGVPVYVMTARGVSVMRRKEDSFLNATQILKVAEFDKPQRTRILEREVHTGAHEKVQGGYGKYQGTWVPLDRAVSLATQYGVLDILRPLLEYVPTSQSPPLAPKHARAGHRGKPRGARGGRGRGGGRGRKRLDVVGGISRGASGISLEDDVISELSVSDFDVGSEAALEPDVESDAGMASDDLRASSRLAPGSPSMGSVHSASMAGDSDDHGDGSMSLRKRRRRRPPVRELPTGAKQQQQQQQQSQPRKKRGRPPKRIKPIPERVREDEMESDGVVEAEENEMDYESEEGYEFDGHFSDDSANRYAEILFDYFVSDSQEVPAILAHPPSDFDPDVIIDEEGHTCLHWAAAMARIKVVRILVNHARADIRRVNYLGETPLMRSVLFTNNFDMRSFPELVELLHENIRMLDKNDRTVFHHIAATAGSKGKMNASRYYMECLIKELSADPEELSGILNMRDVMGDTALHLAARIPNKRLVKLLLDAGADLRVQNDVGKTPEDYIVEADRLVRIRGGLPRSQSPQPTTPVSLGRSARSFASAGAVEAALLDSDGESPPHDALDPVVRKAMSDVTRLFDELSSAHQQELRNKNRDLQEARSLLHSIQMQIQESRRLLDGNTVRAEQIPIAKKRVEELERHLRKGLNRGLRERLAAAISSNRRDPSGVHANGENIRAGGGGLDASGFLPSAGVAGAKMLQVDNIPAPHLSAPAPLSSAQMEATLSAPGELERKLPTPPRESHSTPTSPPSQPVPNSAIPNLSEKQLSPAEREQYLRERTAVLRERLTGLQKSRSRLVEDVVRLRGFANPRQQEYRRLISICCNVPVEQVDELLVPLLEAMDVEQSYLG